MDTLFWIILVASLMVLITLIVSLCTDDNEGVKGSAIITAFITFLCIIGLGVDEPKTMDVYQNKTTLKYTVVDSVRTDSIESGKKDVIINIWILQDLN